MQYIDEIIDRFQSKKLLLTLCEKQRIYLSPNICKRTKMIKRAIIQHIKDQGFYRFLLIPNIDELHALCTKGKAMYFSKQEYIDQLTAFYEAQGLDLIQRFDGQAMLDIHSRYTGEYEHEGWKFNLQDLRDAIQDDIAEIGLYNFFSAFTVTELEDMLIDSNIEYGTKKSKEKFIEALLDVSKEQNNKRKKSKPSSIEHCKDKQTLMSNFIRIDLEEYCRSNTLPTTGTKSTLCRRILTHLNNE